MATYYVSTTGSNGNPGTEASPWLTIDFAADNIANGDTVYVKADGTYSEEVSLNVVGISSAWVQFIGYTTTPGDNGVVTINGVTYGFTTQASATDYYVVLANFKVTSTISHGYNFSSKRRMMFYNCHADTTVAGKGFFISNYSTCVLCTADGCTNEGFDMGPGSCLIYCKSGTNGGSQFELDGESAIIGSLVYGIPNVTNSPGIKATQTVGWSVVIGNTADGENAGSNVRGMTLTNYGTVIFNNIFYDCQIGIDTPSSWNNNIYAGNYNAFISTPSKYDTVPHADSDWDTSGEVDEPSNSDPFTNSAADIYILDATNGANMINAAYDLINGGGVGDIGVAQGGRAVGGGGGIMYHVGMDGGMKG